MADTPLAELLDTLVESYQYVWTEQQGKYFAARQAIESAFSKLREENASLQAYRSAQDSTLATRESEIASNEANMRSLDAAITEHVLAARNALTPEEAAEILEGITKRSTRDKLRAISETAK